MVISAAEDTGLIQVIAEWSLDMSGGTDGGHGDDPLGERHRLGLLVYIPFTTMLPIVAFFNTTIPGAQSWHRRWTRRWELLVATAP